MATIIDSTGTPASESSALSVIDVTLDIRQNRMVSVLLKQYNKQSQQIKFTVTDNGEKIELKEIEHTVLFKMITPDGRRVSSYCAINENDHTAVLTVAKNYCSYPGKGTAELEVMDALEESQVGTMNMDVIIENSVYPDEMINGSSTYQGLDEKINAVREACNSAIVVKEETESIRDETETIHDECVVLNNQTAQNTQLANDYANMAQSYANGESGTREREETDNAKYYYNQTSLLKADTETIKTELLEVQEVVNQKASAAESYATNASNSATEAENSASQTSADREVVTALANEVNNKIGSPLTASAASDMTNQNKIYVYTGSEEGYIFGNWYYYDGSTWVSGGVYNSTAFKTDSTLTYEGEAADSKATGDALDLLKSDIDNVVDVSGLLMQYIDSSKWINKFYFGWNVEHTKPQLNPVDDVLWNCVKIENIPKGTYYYNYAYPQFCFIENRQNGDVVDCSSILVDADGIENNFTVDYDFDLYLTVAKNPISNLAMLCSGIIPNHFVDIGYYSLRDFTVNNKSILTVGKGEKYETIQSACDVANYDDIIFIKCGVYTENVKLWGKRVHLVGQDKLNTILIDHTGNYQTPPLEMSDGSVSNITIIQDNSNPTGTEGDGKYGNSYCIHADWLPVRASNIFEIDNCILINKVWACIGIGLQADYTVRIRNTQMIGESSQPVPTLFCHDSAQDYNYLQYLIVQNCMISSKGGKCVQIDKTTAEGGEAWYQFDGCTIYDENLGSINDIITLTSADNFKKHRSYGNTVQLLNN